MNSRNVTPQKAVEEGETPAFGRNSKSRNEDDAEQDKSDLEYPIEWSEGFFEAKYELGEEIDNASRATVTRCVRISDGATFVVKKYRYKFIQDYRENVLNHFHWVQKLNKNGCKKVVEMVDLYKDDEAGHFLQVNVWYPEAEKLSDFIKAEKVFFEVKAADFTKQVLDSAASFRSCGMVHRGLSAQAYLCFEKDGRRDIVLNEFYCATKDEPIMKEVAGVPLYIAPECY